MEIAGDCGSQIHYYRYILLSFLVSGISTFYRGISGWLIGNCHHYQLFWEQRYKAPSSQNTIQSVSHFLLCRSKEGWSMESWFTTRFHLIDLQWPKPLKTTNANRCKCALSIRSRKLFLRMYGYHMEGKVLFIFKSLSLVNHGRIGLDWRRITCAQSEGTNAIILLLVPSRSVHPNPVNTI